MVSSILYAATLLAASLTVNAQKLAPATAKAPINDVPKIGLGTWYLHNNGQENVTAAITSAMKAGYRHFDGATIYNNQKMLAIAFKEALKQNNLKREDIWVTSKIWSNYHGDKAAQGLQSILGELQMDYLDLLLIHFPFGPGNKADYVETWKAMEKLPTTGKNSTRFIGISNFAPKQIDELLAAAKVPPKAHQFELHPYLQQQDFVDFHAKRNISVVAYAPLGNTNPVYRRSAKTNGQAPPQLQSHSVLTKIAQDRKCASALQVSLAWNLKRGVAVIPKTVHADRQKENIEAENCKLTEEDMKAIKAISTQHAARMNNPCRMAANNGCFEGLQLT